MYCGKLEEEDSPMGRTPRNGITLGDYAREWLSLQEPALRLNTFDQYSRLLDGYILPHFGGAPIAAIRPGEIARWVAAIIQSGKSARTALLCFRLLHKILNDAVEDGLIRSNPAARVRPPKPPQKELDPWGPDEVETLIQGARRWNQPYGALFIFLIGSGLRVGEALALRWRDVDLVSRIVHVRRTVTFLKGGRVHFGEPKSPNGRRDVALPEFAARALEDLRALRPPRSPDDLIFVNAAGRLPTRANIRSSLLRLLRRLRLPAARIHDFRHFHASILFRQGVDPKTVQRRLGHHSAAFTLDFYARLFPDSDAAAARAVDRFIAKE
jgi:integrase